MSFMELSRSVTLENLSEGDVIEIEEYIRKLRFFREYSYFGVDNRFKSEGTYIVDRRYVQFSEIGLHYYKYDTLIEYLTQFRKCIGANRYAKRKVKVCFNGKYELLFEPI